MNYFKMGFKSILPIISGILPFGAVMGSAFSEAGLSFGQAFFMNTIVYAGAAQLATTELMTLNAAVFVVVVTGLIINLRFLLYSAAMAPFLKDSKPLIKYICAFTLTDQGYASMTANQDKFRTDQDAIDFYLGSALCMMLAWSGSVYAGYAFGNFAPAWLNLDYAIPLSFIALLTPTIKTNKHLSVAIFSGVISLVFSGLPFKTGLVVTALISIALAWFLIKDKK